MCQYCLCGTFECPGVPDVTLVPIFTRIRNIYFDTKFPGPRRRCRGTNQARRSVNKAHDPASDPMTSGDAHDPTTDLYPYRVLGGAKESPVALRRDGIRVLLFRECDIRGRKLLYDSKTVIQVPLDVPHAAPAPKVVFKASWGPGVNAQPQGKPGGRVQSSARVNGYAEVCGGYGYQYCKKEGDTKAFGELVFGTVDLAYRGSSSKLHILQDNPHRVLLSRTAPAPITHVPPRQHHTTTSDQGIEEGSFSSSISSLGESTCVPGSLDVPWGLGAPHSLAIGVRGGLGSSNSEGDSGFGGPPSPYSSTCGSFLSPTSLPNTPLGTPSSRQGSGSSLNSGSLNSLQRRFLRSVNTSLEALGGGGAGQDDGRGTSPHKHNRRTKLGLAVIIDLEGQDKQWRQNVEDWLFIHLGVVESAVTKLQTALHSAYLHRQTFVSATHTAVTKLQQDLVDLVNGARLCHPVWLGLLPTTTTTTTTTTSTTAATTRQTISSAFVHTLANVLNTFDTKHTNFFVSKLLTAVLTHHLSWVSTVAPNDTMQQTTTTPATGSQSTAFTPGQASWAERLSECHPYSAVWAQLCELSGAVGYPPRSARTVLLGTNTSLLQQLLTILSYIIRCSVVVERKIEAHTPHASPTIPPSSSLHSPTSQSSFTSTQTIEDATPLQREPSLCRRRSTRRGPGERACVAGDGTDDQTPVHHGTEPQDSVEVEGSRWMLNDGEEIVIGGVSDGGRTSHTHPCLKLRNQISHAPPNLIDSTLLIPNSCKTTSASSDQPHLSHTHPCPRPQNQTSHAPPNLMDSTPQTPNPSKTTSSVVLPTPTVLISSETTSNDSETLQPNQLTTSVPLLTKTTSDVTQSIKPHNSIQSTTSQISQPLVVLVNTPQSPEPHSTHIAPDKPKSLSSSKTSFNLASLVSEDEIETCINIQVPSQPTSLSLYPTLDHIDDHRETFGPVILEPGKIAEKVHKLFRGSPMREVDPKEETHPIAQPPTAPPRTKRKSCEAESVSSTVSSAVSPTVSSPKVVVSAKDIHAEVEEGGRVLLLHHGSTPPHTHAHTDTHTRVHATPNHTTHMDTKRTHSDPNKTHAHTDTKHTHIHSNQTKDAHTHTNTIGFEGLSRVQDGPLTCLPNPVDSRRRVQARNVGRESARDLTKLQAERTVYPTLRELKEDHGVSLGRRDLGNGQRGESQTHRRHHSDPTNGLFSSALMTSLKEVKEEVGDGKGDSCKDEERPGGDSSDPILVNMPRCVVSPHRTTTKHELAQSLMGGVLDHYSSPFVLHASTQTHHWEDALRQDLLSMAHHSPLDPHLAEAVAVVADTETWEVQVVSSHSYVVSSSGGVIGLRVDTSPLVSSITDSVLELTRLGTDPLFVTQHFENLLSEVYLKSHLLAQYLLSGANKHTNTTSLIPFRLPDLTRALSIDVNDLPLLLAVASTHTPALTHMYGLCVR